MRLFCARQFRHGGWASGGGSGYDPATRIANLRANGGFGSLLTSNNADHPAGDGGLALAVKPQGTLTTRNVSTLADAQTHMNGTGNHVTLAPGTYSGNITISTGTHNKLTLTGCTLDDVSISGGSNVHHIEIQGGDTAQIRDIGVWNFVNPDSNSNRAHDIWIEGINETRDSAIGGVNWRVDRCTIVRCTMQDPQGPGFIWPWSTNVLFMNCQLLCPKRSDGEHENPFRNNGGHLCFVIDCRLRVFLDPGATAPLKYCWRSHHSGGNVAGGTNGVINCQLEQGGIFCGSPGVDNLESQNRQLVIVGNSAYIPAGVTGAVNFDIPNDDLYEANDALYMTGNRIYNNDFSGSITSPVSGTQSDNQYAAYTSTPAWSFHTSTPA